VRNCPYPHCGHLIATGKYCPAHARVMDERRGLAAARGYDEAWAKYARRWLRRFPICGQRLDGRIYTEHSACARTGQRVPATVVDHILSLRNGGAKFDPLNHQSLCNACNVRKG
jgi:5-methylcytosine-specific restriction protein A